MEEVEAPGEEGIRTTCRHPDRKPSPCRRSIRTPPRSTQAERAFARNYAPGDIIQPERDYPKRGLQRGALHEITETGPGNRLTVRGEKGEVIHLCPMTHRRLSVCEPERAELAPGDRVLIDAASKSRTTAKDVYYVAISRAQHEARIYTDDIGKLLRAIERENPKHAALDLERRG